MLNQYLVSAIQISSMIVTYWPGVNLRRWGSIIGLCAQPFWVWTIYTGELWGLIPLAPAFTAAYTWAIWTSWREHRSGRPPGR